MQSLIEGLRRVDHYFGGNRSRTKNALGLNGGSLDLALFRVYSGGGMDTDAQNHTVNVRRIDPEVPTERAVQTFVHELGHIVDYQAVRVTGIGAEGKWSRDRYGPWGQASGWVWNGCTWLLSAWGRQGGVSAYAVGGAKLVLNDPTAGGPLPEEDFAETFNWVIERANGQPFWPSGATGQHDQINPYRDDKSTVPNEERRQVIEDLLSRF